MNFEETLAVSLIGLFITAISILAYKHPKGFFNIYAVLIVSVLLVNFLSIAYDLGMDKAYDLISQAPIPNDSKLTVKLILLENSGVNWLVTIISLSFAVFITILKFLHTILNIKEGKTPDKKPITESENKK